LQLFRDQCRDAQAAARTQGLIAFWLRSLFDLLKTSIVEHLSNVNRGKFMLSQIRPTFKPLPDFFKISALIFIPIFLAGALISFFLPETYTSKALVEVDHITPPREFDPNFLLTEFEAIRSHAVLEKVVKAMNLQEVWGRKYVLTDSEAENMIKNRLELLSIRNTKFVEIRAFSHDPQEAANLANGIASAYRDYHQEERIRNGPETPGGMISGRVVTIVDSAVPNPRPIRPNKPLNILIGAFAGILACLVVAPLILGLAAAMRKNAIPPLICKTGMEV
jgi:capsular polysaccharide biosynthesis protein